MKGVMRFGKKGKLSLRYVGPYRILKRIASIVPLESVAMKYSLSYEDIPVEILDRQPPSLLNSDLRVKSYAHFSEALSGRLDLRTQSTDRRLIDGPSVRFRVSASRSRLDQFPISSSAESVITQLKVTLGSGIVIDSADTTSSDLELLKFCGSH
ncbi:hypothetical protein MTR67_017162 [Solanum verrucosum]|uniref:Uncharacterized protein n=1 Tax=Solanum verrucosum TaxID=315347 RepID=A0AAF0QJ74_SOLVR|nr:hypothetical protein MTR67_017162 [Solanum verrucosum]